MEYNYFDSFENYTTNYFSILFNWYVHIPYSIQVIFIYNDSKAEITSILSVIG